MSCELRERNSRSASRMVQPAQQVISETAAHDYVKNLVISSKADQYARFRETTLRALSGTKDRWVQIQRAAFGQNVRGASAGDTYVSQPAADVIDRSMRVVECTLQACYDIGDLACCYGDRGRTSRSV